jgi:hypothetical protein
MEIYGNKPLIIVVTFNSEAFIEKCLDQLYLPVLTGGF